MGGILATLKGISIDGIDVALEDALKVTLVIPKMAKRNVESRL